MEYKILTVKDKKKSLNDVISVLGNLFPIEGLWEKEDEWEIYLPATIANEEIDNIMSYIKINSQDNVEIKINDYSDENIDWNAEWKKGYKPVKISNNIFVYPSWFTIADEHKEKIIVRIDPQMGFGTGTHETTQLMMELIEKYLISSQKILDAGTGSGILSILTEKLYPNSLITAFDIDEDSIENARINENLNNSKNINWLVGNIDLIKKSNFDFILANINREVLQKLIPQFKEKINSSGQIILSGILTEEINIIQKMCNTLGLQEVELKQKNEWTAGVWKKL